MYIHERDNWTDFRWDASEVSLLQEKVFRKLFLAEGIGSANDRASDADAQSLS